MEFAASAPSKLILFGEHYVVYGSPALAIPIEPRNKAIFSKAVGEGAQLSSELGQGTILPDFSYQGAEALHAYAKAAQAVCGDGKLPSCTVNFEPAWQLKGVGVSASLCAAFAAGLFKLVGKKPSAEEIFLAAQEGDLFAHGGRASGIDAKTVSYGKPLVFTRRFSPPSFEGKEVRFSLPKGCELLLVDTFREKKDGTASMVEKFAASFGVRGKPGEIGEGKRNGILEEFEPLWQKIIAGLKSDGQALGELMNENHALLKKRGMSSHGIERAVSAALEAGAYGAKLTGGGGEGGAVVVLCRKKGMGKVSKAIAMNASFECHPLSLADRGACAES